jgi:hypothetical protein
LDENPLIMEAEQSITRALEEALGRGQHAYDPILVRDRSGSLTLLQIDTLLRAQARILEIANR